MLITNYYDCKLCSFLFSIGIISLFFVFPAKIQAAYWYVDNQATGTNTGTSWQNAWKNLNTINWNSVNPGDTVYISGGDTSQIYRENLIYGKWDGTPELPITVDIGANSPDPTGHNGEVVIDANGGNYCINAKGKFNIIKNITCQNASSSGIYIGGTSSTIGVGQVVENCTVRNSYQQGIHVHFCDGCIVSGNRVTTADDIAQQTDGITVYDSSNTLVEKNWIKITNQNNCTACHNDGIQTSFGLGTNYVNLTVRFNYVENTKIQTANAQGIYATQMQGDVKFIGNVVAVPDGNQVMVSRLANNLPVSVYVIGNTIKCGSYYCLRIEDDAPVVKNNLIWQSGATATNPLNGAFIRLDAWQNTPGNIDNNLYYSPYSQISSYAFYLDSSSVSWNSWLQKGYDGHSFFSNSPDLDNCLRSVSAANRAVGQGAIMADEYKFGLAMSLCGQTGPANFLPVVLNDRNVTGGDSWDIGAYEYINSVLPSPSPSPSHCLPLGDTDCSGKVNASDFVFLAIKWGAYDVQADLNNSGTVDAEDAAILLRNYGKIFY